MMTRARKVWWWVVVLLVGWGVVGEIGGWRSEEPEQGENQARREVVEEKQTEGVAVMADIHLDWKNLAKALKTAKDRGNKLIIIAGDLTSLGEKEELAEAKKILDESGVDYEVIPGNHDLWMGERMKKDLFGEIFGKPYQSIRVGGRKYILVNNGSFDGLGQEQKRWLEGEVGECRVVKCVVVAHMPLNHLVSDHVMGEDNPKVASEAAELVRLFRENNIREMIAGHLHYASEYETDDWKTFLTGAITEERNNQTPRFTEFKEGEPGLEREVLVLEEL